MLIEVDREKVCDRGIFLSTVVKCCTFPTRVAGDRVMGVISILSKRMMDSRARWNDNGNKLIARYDSKSILRSKERILNPDRAVFDALIFDTTWLGTLTRKLLAY